MKTKAVQQKMFPARKGIHIIVLVLLGLTIDCGLPKRQLLKHDEASTQSRWYALTSSTSCHHYHNDLESWLKRNPQLKVHVLGMWSLCALTQNNIDIVEQLATQLTQDPSTLPQWQTTANWLLWATSTTATTMPKQSPAFGQEVIFPYILKRAQAEQRADTLKQFYRRYPHIVANELGNEAAEQIENSLNKKELWELSFRFMQLGQLKTAEAILAKKFSFGSHDRFIAHVKSVHGQKANTELLRLARNAFQTRRYPLAEELGQYLTKKASLAEGLLLWGRALARQGKIQAAYDTWARYLPIATGSEQAVPILYRLGLLAEELYTKDIAIGWYLQCFNQTGPETDLEEAIFRAGWLEFRNNNIPAAIHIWTNALPLRVIEKSNVTKHRILYWLSKIVPPAQQALYQNQLTLTSPLSYYTWLRNDQVNTQTVTWQNRSSITLPNHVVWDRETKTIMQLKALGLNNLALVELWQLYQHTDEGTALKLLELAHQLGDAHIAINRFWQRFDTLLPGNPQTFDQPLWQLLYPAPYGRLIKKASKQFDVEPQLLYAVMREESHFRTTAVSVANAMGLLQMLPSTAAAVAKRHDLTYEVAEDLFKPDIIIMLAAAYLDELFTTNTNNLFKTIASYNAGPHIVARWDNPDDAMLRYWDVWVEEIPYAETRNYVVKVLRSYIRYHALYEKKLPPQPHLPLYPASTT